MCRGERIYRSTAMAATKFAFTVGQINAVAPPLLLADGII